MNEFGWDSHLRLELGELEPLASLRALKTHPALESRNFTLVQSLAQFTPAITWNGEEDQVSEASIANWLSVVDLISLTFLDPRILALIVNFICVVFGCKAISSRSWKRGISLVLLRKKYLSFRGVQLPLLYRPWAMANFHPTLTKHGLALIDRDMTPWSEVALSAFLVWCHPVFSIEQLCWTFNSYIILGGLIHE